MLNIQQIINEIKKLSRGDNYQARDDIKKLLLDNCNFISQNYDPFLGDNESLYMKRGHFIVFKEETTHLNKKTMRIHNAFKIKIFAPMQRQIFYLNILGPVVA